MRLRKTFGKSRGALAAVLLAVPLVVLSAPGTAGATVTTCAPAGNVGVGEFPAVTASVNSALKVACTFVNGSGVTETIHDFAAAATGGSARWHNGSARTVTDAHTTIGSPVIWSNTAMFQFCQPISAACGWNDVNHVVTGPGIPAGAFILAAAPLPGGCVAPCTAVTLSYPSTLNSAGLAKVIINNAPSRELFHFVMAAVGSKNFSDAGAATDESTGNFRGAPFDPPGTVNSDIGLTVTGPGVPLGATIATVTSRTTGTLSAFPVAVMPPAACTKTALTNKCNITSIGGGNHASTTRQVQDATTQTVGSTVTSVNAHFVASDAGTAISGNGIPAGSYIKSVTSATVAVTTKPVTINEPAEQVVIGSVNSTAPLQTGPGLGEVVGKLDAEITLNPALVGTPPSCVSNQPEGFEIQATWNNPGSYNQAPSVFGATPPTTGNTIGQILFGNGTSPFAAYIVQVATDTFHAFPHYDFVETFAPIGLADCKTGALFDAVAEAISINGGTSAQAQTPTGFGSPGTGPVRSLDPLTTINVNSATTAKVETPNGTPIAGANPATCTVTQQTPNNPGFNCGLG
jgi:hypothetical protein